MTEFVGRAEELARLERQLTAVREGEARLVSVRGRRQVGKSRLVSTFVERSGLPQLFVTGSRQATLTADLESFRQDVMLNCTLPGVELLAAGGYTTWEQALRAVHAALPPDGPAVVVLDEFPWLLRNDQGLDGTLQKLWDREFERRAVLMVLIGSDLSVMEVLSAHDRPLYGRVNEIVIEPLSVRDVARWAGLDIDLPVGAADAFDAAQLTGGYPRLVAQWKRAPTIAGFLRRQLADDTTELVVTGQRVIDAEFPADVQASTILHAIGAGERAHGAIAQRAGVSATSLSRALATLLAKRVIAVDHPVSRQTTTRLPRYRVADQYLRFWLRFIEPSLGDLQRGRGDLALTRVTRDLAEYRGRAAEPLVRDALTRLAADDPALAGTSTVGGWWTRSNTPEVDLVDLVGLDTSESPPRVAFVGSMKWGDRHPFDERDLAALAQARTAVPGAEQARLVAVARAGCTAQPDAVYSPVDLVKAWA